jgi:hypothetical protein
MLKLDGNSIGKRSLSQTFSFEKKGSPAITAMPENALSTRKIR